MNISVTDLETGVITNAVNIIYPITVKHVVGYTTGGSGSQSTVATPTVTTGGKSHNHE